MSWAEAATQAAEMERDMACLARFIVARLVLVAAIVIVAFWLTGCDAAINLAVNAVGSTVWNAAAR